MWNKFLIVDKSVHYPGNSDITNLKFGGVDTEGKDIWIKDPNKIKLFDDINEAVTVAKRLKLELPIKLINIQIPEQQGQQVGINMTEIIF